MRYGAAILFYATAAFAQHVTTAEQLPLSVRDFSPGHAHAPLPCTVESFKPALNFGLRFQTGYLLRVPLDLYSGKGHHWDIVFRVTAESANRPPVIFTDSVDLPDALQPGFIAELGGMFLLGEGRYDVNWSLLDDLGQVCRQQWTLDARLGAGERSAKVTMPPGTAGDLTWHSKPTVTAGSAPLPRHITLLLNATLPVKPEPGQTGHPSRHVSSDAQWGTLLSILESVLERMPATTVRLVVFNPDQQKELFRQDDFRADQIGRIAHAADGISQWAVGYSVIRNPTGGWDLLTDLENRENRSAVPPDDVVFLGLLWGWDEKLPARARAALPEKPAEKSPRYFYLEYRPYAPGTSAFGWIPEQPPPRDPEAAGRISVERPITRVPSVRMAGRHRAECSAPERQNNRDL